jgi:hypothetical protein
MFIDASMSAITFLHRDHRCALSRHHVIVGGSNRARTQSKCLAWTARCSRCRRRTTRHTRVARVRGAIRHGRGDVRAIRPKLRHRRCGPGRPSPSPRTSRGHNQWRSQDSKLRYSYFHINKKQSTIFNYNGWKYYKIWQSQPEKLFFLLFWVAMSKNTAKYSIIHIHI